MSQRSLHRGIACISCKPAPLFKMYPVSIEDSELATSTFRFLNAWFVVFTYLRFLDQFGIFRQSQAKSL